MEEGKNVVNSQEDRIELIKKEVDALQISVLSHNPRWYKNPATLISVLALVFSFGTTYVSYKRIDAQEIQGARAELRGLLTRLSYLSRDSLETTRKYPNDTDAIAAINGSINQETTLLSRQAAELAKRIPRNYISSTEYWSIALGLTSAYDNERAKEFYAYAIDAAKDFVDKISALRGNAQLMFLMGRPIEGRAEFQKALDVFSQFAGYDENTVVSTHVQTELNWAITEATWNFRNMVDQHLANAERYASGLSPGLRKQQLREQITAARKQIELPTPGIVDLGIVK